MALDLPISTDGGPRPSATLLASTSDHMADLLVMKHSRTYRTGLGLLTGAARLFDFGASLRSQVPKSAVMTRRLILDDRELLCQDGNAVVQDLARSAQCVTSKLKSTGKAAGDEEQGRSASQ